MNNKCVAEAKNYDTNKTKSMAAPLERLWNSRWIDMETLMWCVHLWWMLTGLLAPGADGGWKQRRVKQQ